MSMMPLSRGHPLMPVLETYALVGLLAIGWVLVFMVGAGGGDGYFGGRLVGWSLWQVPLLAAVVFLLVTAQRWLALGGGGVRWLVLAAALVLLVSLFLTPMGWLSMIATVGWLGTGLTDLRATALVLMTVALLWLRTRPDLLAPTGGDIVLMATPVGRLIRYDIGLLGAAVLVFAHDIWAMSGKSGALVMPVWYAFVTAHLLWLSTRGDDPFRVALPTR